MSKSKVFDSVEVVDAQKASWFDLGHNHKTTCMMGDLIPISAMVVHPGELVKLKDELIAEFMPFVFPVKHNIKARIHHFFVPYSQLWGGKKQREEMPAIKGDFEKFIFNKPEYQPMWQELDYDLDQFPVPLWQPQFKELFPRGKVMAGSPAAPVDVRYRTIWSYIHGTKANVVDYTVQGGPRPDQDINIGGAAANPVAFQLWAYNWIYNDYYRDDLLQLPVSWDNRDILKVCWSKDIFTVSRPKQLLGVEPMLNLDVDVTINSVLSDFVVNWKNQAVMNAFEVVTAQEVINGLQPFGIADGSEFVRGTTPFKVWPTQPLNADYPSATKINSLNATLTTLIRSYFNNNFSANANVSSIAHTDTIGFSMAQFRALAQITKWKELNMRAGNRYIEGVKAHYNFNISDVRADRPEFIGGSLFNVMVSQILQTSESDKTNQGTRSGLANIIGSQGVGKYRVKEHGCIMSMLSILPETSYFQGINRQFLTKHFSDFIFPQFQHLSEQPQLNEELYIVDEFTGGQTSDNVGTFGYMPIYSHFRYMQNKFSGEMVDSFKGYHFGRFFDGLPQLNSDFVTANVRNDPFAVEDSSFDNIVIYYGADRQVLRQLSYFGTPGYIDHF